MSAAPATERGRLREVLIFGAFALLCAIGVATVILPEGQSEPEAGDGTPAPTSTPVEPPANQPAK